MPYTKLNNKKGLEARRKKLRRNQTSAESRLWALLKNKQLQGRKFRRQHSVGHYILDFYCPAEKLAVEVDGDQHYSETGLKHDEEREKYLSKYNIRVLRFENCEVFENLERVLEMIGKQFGGGERGAVG